MIQANAYDAEMPFVRSTHRHRGFQEGKHIFTGGRGFSLIEVLVSIVVLSFGMLGMVGMQAAALQSNREARLQSSAVRYARELAEMMRGNRAVGIATTSTANPYLGDFTAPTTSTADCYAGACASALAVAQWEMAEWLTRLNGDLPSARVVVCFDSAPFDSAGQPRWACNNTGNVAVVKIGWTRRSTDTSATGNSAFERAATPYVVLSVTAGSST